MKKLLIFLILFIIFLCFDACYIDKTGVKVKEYKYESSSLPHGFDDFKIAHFSDFLYEEKNDLSHLEEIIKKINDYNPDIIVFTGDLLKNKINDNDKDELINLLKNLKPNLFKYAIKGDNDSDITEEIFNEAGFKFLDDKAEYIFNEDVEPIVITSSKLSEDTIKSLDELEYHFVITLIHEPDDFAKLSLLGDDNLVLAGHSLGGQIRIPFWGAVIRNKGAKTYTDDYYHEKNKTMYISYGIGKLNAPFRLFNKSSINIYRLYSTK